MKKMIIATLLFISSIQTMVHAGRPLMLQNRYYSTTHKSGQTITYKTNLGEGTLAYKAQVHFPDIDKLSSLAIKGAGAYSSLNNYLAELKKQQTHLANINRYPLLVILPTDPKRPLSWNVAWD